MSSFAWRPEQNHFVGTLDSLAVRCDPQQGLAVSASHLGLTLPRILGVEIVSTREQGPMPLAEPDAPPEVVCRQDILWAQFKPTPRRNVECHARWRVLGPGILDLQISTLTPGQWSGLMVQSCTTLLPGDVHLLITDALPMLLLQPFGSSGSYVEMVHPHDGVGIESDGKGAFRFRLFGHDLEKGVILRGRLRGLILPRDGDEQIALEAYDAFVKEPPNLSL
jgi:hypothetical protein